MRKITLKNADKLQTIEITYDGFNYNGKQIQHGALLIVKGTMDFEIGGADEAVEYIQTAVRENGFTAYDEYHLKITTLRDIVHAVESLVSLSLIQNTQRSLNLLKGRYTTIRTAYATCVQALNITIITST